MNRVLISIFSFLFFLNFLSAHGQYSGDYEYSKEMVWGVVKATNSGLIGGFNFKLSKELKEDRFHGGIIEVVNIKHPQEVKYYADQTGNTFVQGKEHYLYSLRNIYIIYLIGLGDFRPRM